MYKLVAARRVRQVFAAITSGDHEAALAGVAPEVHHVFPGDNALGGERHSREAMRRWLGRLDRLFPEIAFEVERVAVRGWPWDMWVAVEWTDRGRGADGIGYANQGAHWVRVRRGRAVEVHAYLDTDKVTAALERMAATGIEEAAAPPITA